MTAESGAGSERPPSRPAQYGPPSYGSVPYGPGPNGQRAVPAGEMLAADADRERTLDVLRAAYGEGRLTKDEWDERSARTLSARTYGELSSVTAGLPAGQLPGPALPAAAGNSLASRPGGYAPAPMPTRSNGAAIASLACGIGIFPTIGITGLPAVIFGHVALRQLRRSGERGTSMAVTGLVLGYLGVIFWAVVLAGWVHG